MSNDFVAVPAEIIEKWLSERKFERTVHHREVVYVRRSSVNPNVCIKVYTSIRVGQAQVRGAGKDAIRACVVFDNGQRQFGIGKFPAVPRVNSVESVLRRTKERILEAVKRANEWIAQEASRPKPWERGGQRAPVATPSAAMVLPEGFQDPCSEPPPGMFGGES